MSNTSTLDSLVDPGDYPITSGLAYLNNAGWGLVPTPVREKVKDFVDDLGTRGSTAFFDLMPVHRDLPREAGARLFGADPSCIALVTNASEAMSQLALSLRPGRGANVVTIDTEIPAGTFPWLRIAEDTGLEVRFADTSGDRAGLNIDDIAALVDENTVAIVVSHVHWISGHRFDLKVLSELAHSHGAILAVDCYQSAGVVPLDVVASGVDMAVTGSFKWLCGFSAAGICYLSPELSERIRPALVGSMTTAPKPPFDHVESMVLEYPAGARRLEYGSSSAVANYSMGQSIEYLEQVGVERILNHVLDLTDRLAAGVNHLGGRIITPMERTARAGILSVEFDGADSVSLATELEAAGVVCSPRMGLLRFSPHLFNSGNDIDRALNALEDLLGGLGTAPTALDLSKVAGR